MLSAERDAALAQVAKLSEDNAGLEARIAALLAGAARSDVQMAEQTRALEERAQMVGELSKENELQRADLARAKVELLAMAPNCPERASRTGLQTAMERILAAATTREGEPAPVRDEAIEAPSPGDVAKARELLRRHGGSHHPRRREARGHHRDRTLDLEKLPKLSIPLIPLEVEAANGVGFVRVGEQKTTRLAYLPSSYIRLEVISGRYKAVGAERSACVDAASEETSGPAPQATAATEVPAPDAVSTPAMESGTVVADAPDHRHASVALVALTSLAGIAEDLEPGMQPLIERGACASRPQVAPGKIYAASVPDWLWPKFLADPSAIAQAIVSKYQDILPLHRQELRSARGGFRVPRSTICGWLDAAHDFLRHIVEGMFEEMKGECHVIGADATSAPVRARGCTKRWHIFVFIGDDGHIVYRYSRWHSTAAISRLLEGYSGKLLVDAAGIYDSLFTEGGLIEVGCWAHVRRYFWKALPSQPDLAFEALAIIARLFATERAIASLPPDEKLAQREATCKPLLALFEEWVRTHRSHADPRGPLAKAFIYFTNQRAALRRFLEDAALQIHNNDSEAALRGVAKGRDAWSAYENETGLRWDTTFRTLIASAVHQHLNPEQYLDEVLRLTPHWPLHRVRELAPKHWRATRAALTAEQRAIIEPPWKAALTQRLFAPQTA